MLAKRLKVGEYMKYTWFNVVIVVWLVALSMGLLRAGYYINDYETRTAIQVGMTIEDIDEIFGDDSYTLYDIETDHDTIDNLDLLPDYFKSLQKGRIVVMGFLLGPTARMYIHLDEQGFVQSVYYHPT